MSIWVDNKSKHPFEGALVVMNMGQNEWVELRPSSEYAEALVSEISEAHAAGMAVIYLFDKGISLAPEHVGWIEDMDFCRLSRSFGMPSLSFSLSIRERQREFAALAAAVRGQDDIAIRGPVKIMGACCVDGERVLMPLVGPIV
jgi:hypothetical protein